MQNPVSNDGASDNFVHVQVFDLVEHPMTRSAVIYCDIVLFDVK